MSAVWASIIIANIWAATDHPIASGVWLIAGLLLHYARRRTSND